MALMVLVHQNLVTSQVRRAYHIAALAACQNHLYKGQWMVLTMSDNDPRVMGETEIVKHLIEDKSDCVWQTDGVKYQVASTRNTEVGIPVDDELKMCRVSLYELASALEYIGVRNVTEALKKREQSTNAHMKYANSVRHLFNINLNIRDPRVRKIKLAGTP